MGLRQKLNELISEAYYEDGIPSECTLFKICNMFDVNSESFKEVKEKKGMENKEESKSDKPSRFTAYSKCVIDDLED